MSLLAHCEGIHEVCNEIEHIVSFAAQGWHQRAGEFATRDPVILDRKIDVKIGHGGFLRPGPDLVGQNGTPPDSPCQSRLGFAGAPKVEMQKSRNGTPSRLGSSARRSCRPARPGKSTVEEHPVPEFLLAEAPGLLEIYRTTQGGKEIGPINRSAKLFEVVLAFCKLRWLIRLHYALVSLGGGKCSLQRLLVSTLSSVCGNHHFSQSPMEMYELIVATLETKFRQAWPVFLAYVGSMVLENHVANSRCDSRFGPHPFVAPHDETREGHPRPYQPFYHPKCFLGKDTPDTSAFLWQVVDDLFISWTVQLDPVDYPMELIFEELDFYEVPRPAVRTNLEGLKYWMHHKRSMATQRAHGRAAQRQAHHLAITLEMPELRFRSASSDEEILEMAREIVANPRTFNAGVRSRVAMVLQGRAELTGFVEKGCALDMDQEQMDTYLSHCAYPRDCGSLDPGQLESIRDHKIKPWLTGRESRYKTASRFSPEPVLRPGSVAEFEELKFSAIGAATSHPISWSARGGRLTPRSITPGPGRSSPIWR